MVVNNENSSCFRLSIGDLILDQQHKQQKEDPNSTNRSFSIDRETCAALLAVGIALKYGILQTCLHATGVALPYMIAVPAMVGCAFAVPVVVTIGVSFTVVVGFFIGGAAIATGAILLPFSPLLFLMWAALRR